MQDIKRLILYMSIFAKVSQTSSHPTQYAHKRSSITFQYMRCFVERSGAKYGRAKCNERTTYTVLYEGSFWLPYFYYFCAKKKVQRPLE